MFLAFFVVADGDKELIAFFVLTVAGIWFVAYWHLCGERKSRYTTIDTRIQGMDIPN